MALKEKSAIVTGASGGIGRAVAKRLGAWRREPDALRSPAFAA